MSWLTEDPLIVWAAGAVALTFALVICAGRRTLASVLVVLAVVAVTAALLGVEWWIETPREAVERTVEDLAAAIEANDLPATLQLISPQAVEIRTVAEAMLPQLLIEKARIISPVVVEVDPSLSPPTATAEFRGLIHGDARNTGMNGTYSDLFEISFELTDDRWQVTDFSTERGGNRQWRP